MLSKLNLDRLGRKTFLYLVSVKYNTNCRLNVELLSGKAEPMNGFTIILYYCICNTNSCFVGVDGSQQNFSHVGTFPGLNQY